MDTNGSATQSAALREVNLRIVELARDAETVQLLCECGDNDCVEHVIMTPRQFDEIIDRNGRVLASGHR